MICVCIFNSDIDIREVAQTGYVDIGKCLLTGVVPNNIAGNTVSFNGIDNPSSIIGAPSDVFDAIRMIDTIQSSSTAESSE